MARLRKQKMLKRKIIFTDELLNNPHQCPVIEHWRDIIEIAYDRHHAYGGSQSREVLMVFSSYYVKILDLDGVPPKYVKNLRKILSLAGFEMVKRYRKETKMMSTMWVLKKRYQNLSLAVIIKRYEERLDENF